MNYFYIFLLLLVDVTMAFAQPSTAPQCNYLTFNGNTDGVQFASRTDLFPAAGGTITFWMKPNSFANRPNVLTTAGIDPDVNPSNGIRFEFEPDGRLSVVIGGPGSTSTVNLRRLTSPFAFSTEWQHIALVHIVGSNTFRLYHNGLLVENGGGLSIPGGPQAPYFGAGLNETRRYNGALDDVVFWNRALTQADVTALQSSTLTGTEQGMQSWYGFNRDGAGGGIDVTDEVDPALVGGVRYDGTTQGNAEGTTPAFVSSTCAPLPPAIVTAPLGSTALCEGSPIYVVFSASGAFVPGNVFRVQLSNSTGSFDNPTVIGSVSSTSAVSIPAAYLPDPLASGSGYRVRVVSTNPIIVGTDNGTDITIWRRSAITQQPISQSVVCAGSSISVPVAVSGTTSSIRWFYTRPGFGAAELTGQTSTTLSLTNVQLSDAGQYQLFIGGPCQSGVSTPFNLTVVGFPESASVTASTNFTASEGSTVSLTALCPLGSVPVARQSATVVGSSTALVFTSPATVGTYSYSVTCRNIANCESSTETLATVTIFPSCSTSAPLQLTLFTTTTPLSCTNNIVYIQVSGARSYTFSPGTTPGSGVSGGSSPFIVSVSTAGVYSVTGTAMNGCTATASTTVSQVDLSPSLTLTANTATTALCPGSPITLSALGCAGGTLRWSTNKTGPSIAVVAIQTTVYSATCSIGSCRGTASLTVVVRDEPNRPTLTASSTAICAGSSTTLTSTGCAADNTIKWSNGQTGLSISVSPTAGTTYRATCTLTECATYLAPKQSLPLTVVVNAVPSVSIRTSSATVCAGTSTVLQSSGCSSGTLTWSTGETGLSLTVSPRQSTTYSATCTGTCPAVSNTLSVTVKSIPSAPSVAASTSAICTAGPASLSAIGCTGGLVRWSNSNSLATQTGNPLNVLLRQTTSYQATCTQNGCSSSTSNPFTVSVLTAPDAPTVTVSQTAICAGSSVTLTATGCDNDRQRVNWSTGASGPFLISTPAATTTYRATCTQNDCVSGNSNPVSVRVSSVPIITVTGLSSVCAGSPVTLRASGCTSGTVTWSTGVTGANLIISPTQSATYSARCISLAGCQAVSSGFSVQVSAPQPPQITASTTALCSAGGIVSLSATGCPDGRLVWSNAQIGADQSIQLTQTTSFYTTCRLPNGCTSPRSNSITVVVSSLRLTPAQVVVNPATPFSLTISGCVGGTIFWSDPKSENPLSFTTAGAAMAYPVSFTSSFSATPYVISARCADGRCADLVRTVRVSSSVAARIGTGTLDTDMLLVVTPVPFTGELTVWLPDANAAAVVSLIDAMGRTHLTRPISAGESSVRLLTNSVPPGVYIVDVMQNERHYTRKILK